jgi:putative membrane protein
MMYNFGYGYNPFGYMGFGFIFMIIFWGLIIFGIVYLIKWISAGQHNNYSSGNKSLDILKERYAKGEISKDQFEQMKKDLNS